MRMKCVGVRWVHTIINRKLVRLSVIMTKSIKKSSKFKGEQANRRKGTKSPKKFKW